MRVAATVGLACMMLGGCASPEVANENCTNIISMGGGLLKFCESNRRLDVSETGVDTAPTASLNIINSPEALKNLQTSLTLRKDLAPSRRLVASACVVNNQTYLNVNIKDLQRILDKAAATSSAHVSKL